MGGDLKLSPSQRELEGFLEKISKDADEDLPVRSTQTGMGPEPAL